MTSQLVPKQIVDVNNRLTTVYVNPDRESDPRFGRIPTIPPRSRTIRVGDYTFGVSGWYDSPFAEQDENGEWTGEPLEHVRLTVNGRNTLSVAPPGLPGLFCSSCGSFLDSDGLFQTIDCHICHERDYVGRTLTALREDHVRFVSPDEIAAERWFHVTSRQDWDYAIAAEEFDEQPLVHVGTFEAARQRGEDNYSDRQQLYLFEVAIIDDAIITPGIIYDDNQKAPRSIADSRRGLGSHYAHQYQLDGVTAYLNQYEDIGSVSLITHPSAIRAVEMRPFDPMGAGW